MKRRIIPILTFFCLAFGHSPANASGSLFLSGAIIDTKVICVHEKPAVEINLLMQWRNDGNEALILLDPFYIFETRVTFGLSENASVSHITGDVLSYNPYLKDPFGKATEDDYDPVTSSVRIMKGRFLAGREVTLEPGGYHESMEIVRVRNGFRFVDADGKTATRCGAAKLKAKAKHQYFKLEYFLSLKNYKGGEDALTSLRLDWRNKGNFLLNSGGDISYRSESIPFHDDTEDK